MVLHMYNVTWVCEREQHIGIMPTHILYHYTLCLLAANEAVCGREGHVTLNSELFTDATSRIGYNYIKHFSSSHCCFLLNT